MKEERVCVDLLQVDLLRAERALFGREEADRERRSRERSTCLAWWVFIRISRQKWGVAWLAFGVLGFICESLTWMAELDFPNSKSMAECAPGMCCFHSD